MRYQVSVKSMPNGKPLRVTAQSHLRAAEIAMRRIFKHTHPLANVIRTEGDPKQDGTFSVSVYRGEVAGYSPLGLHLLVSTIQEPS